MTEDLQLPEPAHVDKRLLVLSSAIFIVGLTLLLGAIIVSLHQTKPWDPLGEYPIQTVSSRVRGVEGPAESIDNPVIVTGTKCTRTEVKVRGSQFWQSITPPGMFVNVGAGVAVYPKGCNTQTFYNAIPPAVQAAARREVNPVHRWIITGTETPVRDSTNGSTREGVPRAWSTQEFEVVP